MRAEYREHYQTVIITVIIDHTRLLVTFMSYEQKPVSEVHDRWGYSKLDHYNWYDTPGGHV
jgi:hypothetical protein